MKAVIIDDELDKIVPVLDYYLRKYAPDIKLYETADTIDQAYQLILSEKPDLVFLDVEIGNTSGFDLLKRFSDPDFMVVFVTGHEHYAKQAIKYGALDYLSKPVIEEDFVEAITRVKQRKLEKKQIDLLLSVYEKLLRNELPDRMVIHEVGHNTYIELSKIRYLKADEFTTTFFLQEEKKPIVSSRNLGYYEEQLTGQKLYVRTHRSFIANIKEVVKYNKTQQCFILKDNTQIPLGAKYREDALKALNNISVGK